MEYVVTFKGLLVEPSEFFKKMPRNENYFDPLIFAGICSIPLFIMNADLNSLVASYTGFVIGLITRLFVNSLILHVLLKVFGGTASFKNTFQIYAYSNATEPFAALMGYLSIMTLPYQLYIRARGGQLIHNLGLGKSVVAAVIIGVLEVTQGIIIFGAIDSL